MVSSARKQKYFFSLIALQVIVLSFPAIAAGGNPATGDGSGRSIISYSVSNKSWLSLKGTTNINSFECLSGSPNSRGYILADTRLNENRVDFTGADITVNVNSFDCRNSLITRDMHTALGGAENAGIEIRLLDIKTGETDWFLSDGNIGANILITINGVSKKQHMSIDWHRTEAYEYYFEGTTNLSMSDFEIDPPSPAMGLVKVNDKITVNFNYNIQTSIISRLD